MVSVTYYTMKKGPASSQYQIWYIRPDGKLWFSVFPGRSALAWKVKELFQGGNTLAEMSKSAYDTWTRQGYTVRRYTANIDPSTAEPPPPPPEPAKKGVMYRAIYSKPIQGGTIWYNAWVRYGGAIHRRSSLNSEEVITWVTAMIRSGGVTVPPPDSWLEVMRKKHLINVIPIPIDLSIPPAGGSLCGTALVVGVLVGGLLTILTHLPL